MKFLLVNANPAVRKIFNITAKKANISLDVVSSISDIPLKEDYNCIFIDDGVLNTGDFEHFKNKMITTKFCLILSKDNPLKSGFDSYIRKPFLPTDIYEVLRKEKYSDISLSSNSYEDIQNNKYDLELNLNTSDNFDINANKDIDLTAFSDNDDEFLSGIKDDFPATNNLAQNLDEIPTNEDSVNENNSIDLPSPNSLDIDLLDEISPDTNQVENIENNKTMIVNTEDIIMQDKDSMFLQEDIKDTDQPQQKNKTSQDDIDFDSIFAIQDKFLETEEKNKKKSIIGGDIYKKKEPQTIQSQQENSTTVDFNNISDDFELEEMDKNVNNMKSSSTNDKFSTNSLQEMEDDFDISDNLDELEQLDNTKNVSNIMTNDNQQPSQPSGNILDNIDINNLNIKEDSKSNQTNSKVTDNDFLLNNWNDLDSQAIQPKEEDLRRYNMLGLPLNEDGNVKDINDLSDDELENLDDEALLLLQEQSLDNLNNNSLNAESANLSQYKANEYEIDNSFAMDEMQDFQNNISQTQFDTNNEPKILNKEDITELTNILEDANQVENNGFMIQSDDFSSLTQEALSEALREENMANNADYNDADFNTINLTQDSTFNEDSNFNQADLSQTNFSPSFKTNDDIQFNPMQVESNNFQNQMQGGTNLAQMTVQEPNTQINVGNSQSNVNLDLTEIIKTFPIDKLRELLSGVQITINITFPTKK